MHWTRRSRGWETVCQVAEGAVAMRIRLPKFGRKTYWTAGLLAAVVALIPSYVRAYELSGSSDAPTLLLGDRVLVSLAAYQIRLPYTDVVLYARTTPRPGDLVLVQWPGDP